MTGSWRRGDDALALEQALARELRGLGFEPVEQGLVHAFARRGQRRIIPAASAAPRIIAAGRQHESNRARRATGARPPASPAAAIVASREARLFIALAGLFVTNALIAEFVGVKIFALEDTLGLEPFDWRLFGQSGSLSFTAGVMLWPVVFIMTDVINEHFGVRGVRLISWLAVGFIVYAFVFAYLAIGLAPAGWWVTVGAERGVPDMQAAFANIFGQGLWTIGGSVTAFLVGQLDRRRRVPAHPARDRRALGLAARDRLDRRLAARRQLHRALHRLRARPAALADPAVPRGRHGQLPLQDGDGDRADPAAVPRPAPDPRLPRAATP